MYIRSDGKVFQGVEALRNRPSGDPPPPLCNQQQIPYFQMPKLRDDRTVVFEMRKGHVCPRLRFIVKKPDSRNGRIQNKGAHERWPSWRAVRISSVDMRTRCHWARRARKRRTASLRDSRSPVWAGLTRATTFP